MPTLNFFDNYVLQALVEEIAPRQTFFKDRYFPTAPEDIFAADKVLTEYRCCLQARWPQAWRECGG